MSPNILSNFCSFAWERTSVIPALDPWYLIFTQRPTYHSNTLGHRRTKPAGQLREWWEKKNLWRGRIRGGENKERKGAERRGTGGPIDFRASLVFFWSLNCCPHSPFPLSHPLSLSPPAVPSAWFHPCIPGRGGGGAGGAGGVEVEVVTAPVGD